MIYIEKIQNNAECPKDTSGRHEKFDWQAFAPVYRVDIRFKMMLSILRREQRRLNRTKIRP